MDRETKVELIEATFVLWVVVTVFLILLTLSGCGSSSGGSEGQWTFSAPLIPTGYRAYDVQIEIAPEGLPPTSIDCAVDTAADAPENAMWLGREQAAALGLTRFEGCDELGCYHWYDYLDVSVGNYSRQGVTAYEFSNDEDSGCLIGFPFFVGLQVQIDESEMVIRGK